MKTRMVLLFGVALVAAGLAPVLYFAALFVWQVTTSLQAGSWIPLPATLLFTEHSLLQAGKAAPVLAFIPELRWTAHDAVVVVLNRLHVGLLPALAGLAVMALGTLSAFRQVAVIRFQKQQYQNRLRRTQDYRREVSPDAVDGRREPFISSAGIIGPRT